MISIYELAAFGAALSWAAGSLMAAITVRHMGTLAFNRYRLTVSALLLGAIILIGGNAEGFNWGQINTILVSGFIGIFLGDTALFAAVRRLGVRRAQILFSMNAPMSALLAALLLNETLTIIVAFGIAITMIGVILAITFGKQRGKVSHWEDITPPLWIGIALGLLAALGQAIGALIIRPVMVEGGDPFVVAMIRVAISALACWMVASALPKANRMENPMNPRIAFFLFANAVLGMVIGMTLIMYALSGAKAGVVMTLSSTTPVLILPILWIASRKAPALGAWIGAILVVIGSSMIFVG